MRSPTAAVGAIVLGIILLWPLIYGVWSVAAAPVVRITGADWVFFGFYLLSAAIGGGLIAFAFRVLDYGSKQ